MKNINSRRVNKPMLKLNTAKLSYTEFDPFNYGVTSMSPPVRKWSVKKDKNINKE